MKLFKVQHLAFRCVWDNTILVSSANKTKAKTVDELTMSLIYINIVMDPILNPVGLHI